MIIKYVSSNRDEFEFYSTHMKASEGNYHEYAWKMLDGGFQREMAEYELTFVVRGTESERKSIIDRMTNAFETDIAQQNPGRFIFGDYSISGYVTFSSTYASEMSNRTERRVKISCTSGFWEKQKGYSFATEKANAKGTKRYPNRYAYRYAARKSEKMIINDGYAPAQFNIYIYGPAVNPDIYIGENRYSITVTLMENERLEIDSKNETIFKILNDGTKVNEFGSRQKGINFFKGIAPGVNSVMWYGDLTFDINLKIERSEPEWL